ncbi:hypothetical protein NXY56_007135 [Leishmania guyanensis]
MLAGLAGGLLCVVEGVTGTAAPAEQVVAGIIGDVLGLRFELFRIIFGILTTDNGSRATLVKLAIACNELLACL